jgi:hypothetical protein
MTAVLLRRKVMQYRGREFQYDADNSEIESESGSNQSSSGKQYRKKRAIQATRKRTPKSGSHPGCGIGARRNNRWTW